MDRDDEDIFYLNVSEVERLKKREKILINALKAIIEEDYGRIVFDRDEIDLAQTFQRLAREALEALEEIDEIEDV